MPIRCTIGYRGSPEAKKAVLQRAVKEGLRGAVEEWHSDMLPLHFLPAAEQRYRYKRRTEKYLARKRRQYGHVLPLVFSGEMRRQVTRQVSVSGTAKSARAVLRGPRWLYAYRKSYGQPDKAQELTAITRGEGEKLARTVDRLMQARLDATNPREEKKP